jgi:hypothetical protein
MAPLVKTGSNLPENEGISLSWKENPASKKLLDTLVAILAEEYIQKAKENPEIFQK